MNIPIIVIGLGGIGSEIVEEVEKKMQKSDPNSSYNIYKRDNVRFVIMDTDINSIREREKSGYKGYMIRLSDNISVSNCLEHDLESADEWFPNNKKYSRKSVTEGAGQVRSISRLVLHRAIRNRKLEPLYKAIEDLHMANEGQNEQEMKVVIVSTVAGGTGSGIILPLGIHIRDHLNRKYSAETVKINTFLILPDVLYSVISSNKEKRNLDANGYATVREIDTFMKKDNADVWLSVPNEENDDIKQVSESPL